MIIAPGMASSLGMIRPITAPAEWLSPSRCENGLRLENTIPWFGAAPLKLKPITENTPSTSGSAISSCSACLAMLPVYSSDEPAGACTWVMK